MASPLQPNKNLLLRGQGLQGLGLCLLLAILAISSLFHAQPLIAIAVLLFGGIPAILTFLKGKALCDEGHEGLTEEEKSPPQSALLQLLRVFGSFVATAFILITALGLIGLVIATTMSNPQPLQSVEIKKEAPWYLFILLPAYLIAWGWALYLTFPRFKSLGARIGLAALLATFVPITFLVIGIGGALAIPALHEAKKRAHLTVAQSILLSVDRQAQAFKLQQGRSPSDWKELNIAVNGTPISSGQDPTLRLPEGARLEVEGIDGATSTRVLLADGSILTPEGVSRNLESPNKNDFLTTAANPSTPSASTPNPPEQTRPPSPPASHGELIVREINQKLLVPPGWKAVRLTDQELPAELQTLIAYKITSPQGDGELAMLITPKDPRISPRGDILVNALTEANIPHRVNKSQIQSVKPPTVIAGGRAASTTLTYSEKDTLTELVVFAFVIDNRLILLSRTSSNPNTKEELKTLVRSIKM
jgi:hypothetical protein